MIDRMGRARWVILCLMLLLLPACSTTRKTIGLRLGPDVPANVKVDAWQYEGSQAYRLTTQHYTIYTTLKDLQYANEIAQVMEGAFDMYCQLTGIVPIDSAPMNCYVFGRRDEWADFTRRNTGSMAGVYLQISRGGYTLRDWYVAYDLGDTRTYSVAAHEGWHQFVARNFAGRLPPFLEEGIACMFEDMQVKDGLPRFNLSVNRIRAHALRRAIEKQSLLPLSRLATLHAGEIVGRSGEVIDTFYSQNWAFAKFLREADQGKYAPVLQHLLADTAAGRVYDPSGTHRRNIGGWDPDSVGPILEHYFNLPMEEINRRYMEYLKVLAYEEYQEQFAS